MSLEVDYLPVATAGGANVDSQANFSGSGYQTEGFQAGLAQSKQLNKVWRQSSMMAAALANFIANTLGINVLDDGNISTLIANLAQAILLTGTHVSSVNVTPVSANAATSGSQQLMSYVIPAGSLNQVGKSIRLRASGTLNFGPTLSFPVTATLSAAFAGSCSFQANSNTPALTQMGWGYESVLTCISTGTSGNLIQTAQYYIDTNNGSGGPVNTAIFTNGLFFTAVVDLTSAITNKFFVQFSSSSSAAQCVQDSLIIEALN